MRARLSSCPVGRNVCVSGTPSSDAVRSASLTVRHASPEGDQCSCDPAVTNQPVQPVAQPRETRPNARPAACEFVHWACESNWVCGG